MANVLFLGDFHAGHKAIAKYRTMFSSEEEHFNYVKEEYHRRVTKRDKCIFTGDAVFSMERAREIASWPGQKELICGNHDTDSLTMAELCEIFDDVYSLKKYKEFWLSHVPIHPAELRGKANIHGHVHDKTIDDIRYFNTSLENTSFKLISLSEIRDIMNQRQEYYETKGLEDFSEAVLRIPVGMK